MDPIVLKIDFIDGTSKNVSTVAADLIAFEERFDMSIASLQNSIRMTHLFFIAWHVSKRTGETKDEFEKWVESVNMVSVGEAKK
jgi:hypothetical protein